MGVAPEARLVDVKVTDDYGMGNTSDVVAGLQWIYSNRSTYNIKVANQSAQQHCARVVPCPVRSTALEVLWFSRLWLLFPVMKEKRSCIRPPMITLHWLFGSMDDKGTNDISDDKLSTFSAYGT
ncbi:MAG: hypothetical protein R2932_16735 [Caldilineaceae bacterium]